MAFNCVSLESFSDMSIVTRIVGQIGVICVDDAKHGANKGFCRKHE